MKFLTLDDVQVEGKTIFIRPDLNCPVEKGKAQLSPRMVEHAKTIFELMQKGAKVVILAHQGRVGKDDFISLKGHAKMLEKEIGKLAPKKTKIAFVADVAGKKAQDTIKKLDGGQALLLENVRFLDDEEKFEKSGKSTLVQNLAPLCDIFVLDAFSVAHRAHASVVGFGGKCPCVAGRVIENELNALCKFESPKKPSLLILGGAKPSDSLPIMKQWLETGKADYALCGGAMGNLMLMASGKSLGKPSEEFLSKNEALEDFENTKKLYLKFKSKILIPSDVVVDEGAGNEKANSSGTSNAGAISSGAGNEKANSPLAGGNAGSAGIAKATSTLAGSAKTISVSSLPSNFAILDIGRQTVDAYSKQILQAGSIVLNGPMGVYEKAEFASGTKAILQAVANSPAFSLLGGGHTLSALEKFKISYSKFGYVSLSGKALVEYLSGEKLPGVKMLEDAAKK